jgi:hypothetical protein
LVYYLVYLETTIANSPRWTISQEHHDRTSKRRYLVYSCAAQDHAVGRATFPGISTDLLAFEEILHQDVLWCSLHRVRRKKYPPSWSISGRNSCQS